MKSSTSSNHSIKQFQRNAISPELSVEGLKDANIFFESPNQNNSFQTRSSHSSHTILKQT